jgi:NAD(P)-dependent dehydrogenase (short-subunit alcohol dehydrogenase family)
MSNHVCLITGATDGIGKEAACALAQQGARLLIQGRDPDKGARAVAELKSRSGNAAIEFLQCDFSSLTDVRRLAAAVMERTTQIDILINNAGGIFAKRALSQDGYELTFAVNHLAPFLLTKLLLNTLRSSAPARIVTTSSVAHRGAKLNFDDLQAAGKYSPMSAYGSSKLANILFTRALAKRLEGTTVTANCLHPGLVRTNIARDMPAIGRVLFNLLAKFARSPEQGAQTIVYLASSPQVQGASGGYYVDRKLMPISPAAQDDAAAERLWQVSEQLTGDSAGGAP